MSSRYSAIAQLSDTMRVAVANHWHPPLAGEARAAFSVKRQGIVVHCQPLVREGHPGAPQYGLNRSAGSAPARSCITIAIGLPPLLCSGRDARRRI